MRFKKFWDKIPQIKSNALKYQLEEGSICSVWREGDVMMISSTGQNKTKKPAPYSINQAEKVFDNIKANTLRDHTWFTGLYWNAKVGTLRTKFKNE